MQIKTAGSRVASGAMASVDVSMKERCMSNQQIVRAVTARAQVPSRNALAARSWTAVKRTTDPKAHRKAINTHFDRFGPALGLSRS